MELIDERGESLRRTEEKAKLINEESKNFERNSRKLVWHLWIRKNLVWIVLIILVVSLYYILF